jgi:hypothetical protein
LAVPVVVAQVGLFDRAGRVLDVDVHDHAAPDLVRGAGCGLDDRDEHAEHERGQQHRQHRGERRSGVAREAADGLLEEERDAHG